MLKLIRKLCQLAIVHIGANPDVAFFGVQHFVVILLARPILFHRRATNNDALDLAVTATTNLASAISQRVQTLVHSNENLATHRCKTKRSMHSPMKQIIKTTMNEIKTKTNEYKIVSFFHISTYKLHLWWKLCNNPSIYISHIYTRTFAQLHHS